MAKRRILWRRSFISLNLWSRRLRTYESQVQRERPLCHHHGRRPRRTFLARQPGKNAQATDHAARETFLSPASRRSRVARGAAEEHHHHHERGSSASSGQTTSEITQSQHYCGTCRS